MSLPPPWKYITLEDLPALPKMEEYVVFSVRSLLWGNRNGYQRRLNAPDNILYWKLSKGNIPVYDLDPNNVLFFWMENNALRKARRKVAKYEKNIKEAEVKADLQRRREGLAELPDDNQHFVVK
ncbi:hypothetical protein Tco_1260199 [Tanacetum coccineum]